MSEQTFTCNRCGKEWPHRQMKEVMYEVGRRRIRKQLCPQCLDEVMRASEGVNGIVGDEKRAAIHVAKAPEGMR